MATREACHELVDLVVVLQAASKMMAGPAQVATEVSAADLKVEVAAVVMSMKVAAVLGLVVEATAR